MYELHQTRHSALQGALICLELLDKDVQASRVADLLPTCKILCGSLEKAFELARSIDDAVRNVVREVVDCARRRLAGIWVLGRAVNLCHARNDDLGVCLLAQRAGLEERPGELNAFPVHEASRVDVVECVDDDGLVFPELLWHWVRFSDSQSFWLNLAVWIHSLRSFCCDDRLHLTSVFLAEQELS